jgi:hypothetical protein
MSEPNRVDCFIAAYFSSRGRQLNTERLYFSGLMRSVDYWPLAKYFIRRLGVSLGQ